MKKYMKMFVFLLLTLGLVTACSKREGEIIIDEPPIVDTDEIPNIDDEVVDVEDNGEIVDGEIDVSDDPFAGVEGDKNKEDDEIVDVGNPGGNSGTSDKKLEDLAIAVLEGEYGKGSEIKRRLEAAGHNFKEVDEEVKKIQQVLAGVLNRPGKPGSPSNPGGSGGTLPVPDPGTGGGSGGGSKPGKPSSPEDKTGPIIRLNGSQSVTIETGDIYSDAGAVATDDVDGEVSVNVTYFLNGGSVVGVDTKVPGKYEVRYNAKDSAGNKATQVVRSVLVKKEVITVLSVDGFPDVDVVQGSSYELPRFATVNLSNSETRRAVVKWDSGHSSKTAGKFTISGTVDLSLLEEVVETKLKASVNIIVSAAPVVESSISADRIIPGDVSVSNIKVEKEVGNAKLTTKYVLDKNSYIDGVSKQDLAKQLRGQGRLNGVGYHSIAVVSPKDEATHVQWKIESNQKITKVSNGSSAIENISGKKGKNLYYDVAKEVNANLQFEAGSKNWAPVDESEYKYIIEWYVGNPATNGTVIAIDLLSVDVVNDYTLASGLSEKDFLNELRKPRKTHGWIDELPGNLEMMSLVEAGFYRPFVSEGDDGTSTVVVSYYDIDKALKSMNVKIVEDVNMPLMGTKNALDGEVKNKSWYKSLINIQDGLELPDANKQNAYNPFRIAYEEIGAKDSVYFYYDNAGALIKDSAKLKEDVILGIEKEKEFNETVHNLAWYRKLIDTMTFEAGSNPSVFKIGAYSAFLIESELIDTTTEYIGTYHYYDKLGTLIDAEFKLTDGAVPIKGSIHDLDKEPTVKWFEDLVEYSNADGTNNPYEIGAYVWFKLADDEYESQYHYTAYYYTPTAGVVREDGELTRELVLHGSQESIDATIFDEDWNANMKVVPSLEDPSASWQEMGAYKWFKIEQEEVSFDKDPLEFKAYYYNENKELVPNEGVLSDVDIKVHGTQGKVDSQLKDSEWFNGLPVYSNSGFESHWYHVGAYKLFAYTEDDVAIGSYRAYYYNSDKEIQELVDVLEDEIVLHGTRIDMELAVKNREWWDGLPRVQSKDTLESSWLTMGAYKFFIIEDSLTQLQDEDSFIAYYYTASKDLVELEGDLDLLEIVGSEKEMEETIRNNAWFTSIDEYEDIESAGWQVTGAYKWFKLKTDIDLNTPYAKYIAYYYDENKNLILDSNTLVDEIDLGGRLESDMEQSNYTFDWYAGIDEVDNIGSIEGSWLTIGAYKWFKISSDDGSLAEDNFKAYYYNKEKDLVTIEGELQLDLVFNGTQEDMDNTVHTWEWYQSLYEFDTYADADWKIIGAYKWFRLADNDPDVFEVYSAYYYDGDKVIQMKVDTLVDEIVIHGTQAEMTNTEKTQEWYGDVMVVGSNMTHESSWLNIGAYQWFRIGTDEGFEEGPSFSKYIAHYYTDEGKRVTVEGTFGPRQVQNLNPRISHNTYWEY